MNNTLKEKLKIEEECEKEYLHLWMKAEWEEDYDKVEFFWKRIASSKRIQEFLKTLIGENGPRNREAE